MPNPVQAFSAIMEETPPGAIKELNTYCKTNKQKNYTTLDNRTTIEERTKNSGETITRVFWQISINEQRPKLKIYINDVVTEDLVDTGREGYNNNFIRILASKLPSSGCTCSAFKKSELYIS